jgi:hypothetical protein
MFHSSIVPKKKIGPIANCSKVPMFQGSNENTGTLELWNTGTIKFSFPTKTFFF